MDNLATHPICEMFAQAVDPERDEAPGYFNVVTKPMDLSKVRSKLEKRQYSTVSEWKDDVNLVFQNAISYNGKGSPVGIVACELQSIFRNLVKVLTDDQNSTWFNELLQLRREMCDHVAQRTQSLFGHAHSSISTQKQNPTVVESTAEVRRLVVNSMPKGELERLASNLALLTDPPQLDHIAIILERGNPEVDSSDGASIDMNLLSPQTLRELKDFAVSELSIKGQAYY
jgi:hypothetical protein